MERLDIFPKENYNNNKDSQLSELDEAFDKINEPSIVIFVLWLPLSNGIVLILCQF